MLSLAKAFSRAAFNGACFIKDAVTYVYDPETQSIGPAVAVAVCMLTPVFGVAAGCAYMAATLGGGLLTTALSSIAGATTTLAVMDFFAQDGPNPPSP